MQLALGLLVLGFGFFLLWLGLKGYSFQQGYQQIGLGGKAS